MKIGEKQVTGILVGTQRVPRIYIGTSLAYTAGAIGLDYTLSDDGTYYSVAGIGTCTDADVVIPSSHKGKPVTSIGDSAFSNCDSLTSVVVPDSVTSIGDSAFSNCDSLTSVVISGSVTSISNYAFYGCRLLENIEIPNSITSIGERAFYECRALTIITFGGTIAQWNAVSLGYGWWTNSNLTNGYVQCTDGQVSL